MRIHIVERWMNVKKGILGERERILAQLATASKAIKEACGQNAQSIEVTQGSVTYTFHYWSWEKEPNTSNLETDPQGHWSWGLAHYEALLAQLKELGPTEIEYRLLKLLEEEK